MRAYRILTISTILLPMTLLLLFFYITSNDGVEELLEAPRVSFPTAYEGYDYITDDNDYWDVDEVPEGYFELEAKDRPIIRIYFHSDLMIYNGVQVIEGTVAIQNPEFFIMGRDFYTYNLETGELELFDAISLVKEKALETQIVKGLSVFIVLGAGAGIALMVVKKMELLSRHRRLSVLISSATFTVIWLMISFISTQVSLVFVVFTLSWLVYYIEWLIYRKKNGLPLNDKISERVVITNE